ncbi:conserved hypothetical protein [Ricinus communis]|uniref:Uncharacterized protein n=1 Tax=Ricinus communis TaxID=3988 RepID=B9SP23_RICCO|nr:conserved hypothetical protein [Ricinus communis]
MIRAPQHTPLLSKRDYQMKLRHLNSLSRPSAFYGVVASARLKTDVVSLTLD